MISVEPLAAAVSRMNAKTPIASTLSSAEWSEVPLALRERAVWTARMAQADVVNLIGDMLQKRLALETHTSDRGETLMSRDNFMVALRDKLEASGYVPPRGKEGTLLDHTSAGRMGMIFDINTQQAQEFARWKAGSDPDVLDGFPCQELYRGEGRMVPRDWHTRWGRAGGSFYQGRMIAALDDPIWYAISEFGTPFPPYDYQSGMDVRSISRREAEALGVIEPGQTIEPPTVGFNDNLQKSVARLSKAERVNLEASFGNRIDITGDIAKWKAQAGHQLSFLFDAASPSGNQANKDSIKSVNALLSDLHDLPAGPIIPIADKVRDPVNEGEYWSRESIQQKIGVKEPGSPTGNFAQTHEVGHFLDELLSGPAGGFASRAVESPDVIHLMGEIYSSQGWADAMAHDHLEGVSYWAEPQELFSRAYAQWAAVKSNDTDLMENLGIRQGFPFAQWGNEDFKPIEKAMDQLLENRRLKK